MKYAILIILVFALLLCGCQRMGKADLISTERPDIPPTTEHHASATDSSHPSDSDLTQPDTKKAQLFCQVDTRENAEEIAALYGIELITCQNGLATFWTAEEPMEVIQWGNNQGWPTLYLNYTIKLH